MSRRLRLDRTTVTVIAVILVFGAAYAWLTGYIRAYYERTSPVPSVSSDASRGLSVWFAYLQALGRAPRTLTTFDELPARGTIVIAGPLGADAAPGDAARLAAWVRRGGHLVLVSTELQGLLDGLGMPPPPAAGAARASLSPSFPGLYADGVRRVVAGPGRFDGPGGPWVTHYRDGDGALVVSRAMGRGDVTWLADARPVSNIGIGEADNARLAVLLATAAEPVYFDEYHQGFRDEQTVWSRLGDGGRAAAVLLLAAILVAVIARARRLGPVIEPSEAPAARGTGHIGQLAELYCRAGARAETLETLEAGVVRALARRYGTSAAGHLQRPGVAAALDASAALRVSGTVPTEEFLAAARSLQRARDEVEGTHE